MEGIEAEKEDRYEETKEDKAVRRHRRLVKANNKIGN